MEEFMDDKPKIDLCFHIVGKAIPVDHGFALYSSLSKVLPSFHEENDAALKLIRGTYSGNGMLALSPSSELILRIPTSRITEYLQFAGKSVEIMGHRVSIGVPITRALVPSAALYAHLVTTKNGNDQTRFEIEMRNQMDKMGIYGKATPGERRTFQVHGKQVVGYSLLVTELTARESILLQEKGLGGRRKMGCGFFEPQTHGKNVL
jgi:CRISPR-associated protein Cas6